ncbi:hypothetical protein ENBRE01_1984 [Enteropsectra breve]|nr:hypothetical protein ENBRE01_1984 [Enteropsectra breve]
MSVACKTKSAAEVKLAFMHLFRLFGELKILQRDNGTDFKNSLLREYTDSLYIRHAFRRPRYPQTQGQIERLNQTQKSVLSSLVLERGTGVGGLIFSLRKYALLIQQCTLRPIKGLVMSFLVDILGTDLMIILSSLFIIMKMIAALKMSKRAGSVTTLAAVTNLNFLASKVL